MDSGTLTVGSNSYATNIRGNANSAIGGKKFSDLAVKSDITVSAAGNNTFTGDNIFGTTSITGTTTIYGSSTSNYGVQIRDIDGLNISHYQADRISRRNIDSSTATITNAEILIPVKSGTMATLEDITVTASGNNTFTGMNNFSSTLSCNNTLIVSNGTNLLDNAGLKYDSITRYTKVDNTYSTYKLTFPLVTGNFVVDSADNTFTGSNIFSGKLQTIRYIMNYYMLTTGYLRLYNGDDRTENLEIRSTEIRRTDNQGAYILNVPKKSGTIAVCEKSNDLKSELLELIYPVGSIYMSVNNVSPQTFLGGTWVSWGSGKVPIGVDTSNTNYSSSEKTGGSSSSSYTLSTANIPAHSHTVPQHTHNFQMGGSAGTDIWSYNAVSGSQNNASVPAFVDYSKTTSSVYAAHATGKNGYGSNRDVIQRAAQTTTGNTGSNTPTAISVSTIQPYITCYMWKRTA